MYSHTVEVTVDLNYRAHIIGRNGITINKIRADTGCLIMILKTNDAQYDRIVIRGVEESCQKAFDIIDRIIKAQEVRQEQEKEVVSSSQEVNPTSSTMPVAPSITTRVVPGWSQPKSAGIPITSVQISITPLTASSEVGLNPSPTPKADSWQSMTKRGKVIDTLPSSETSGSSKRKKRKAKNTVNVDIDDLAAIARPKFSVGSSRSLSPSDASTMDSGHVVAAAIVVETLSKKSSSKERQASPPRKAEKDVSRSKSPQSKKTVVSVKEEEKSIRPASPIRHIPAPPPVEEWQTIKRGGSGSTASPAKQPNDSGLSLSSQAVNAAAVALGLADLATGEKKKRKPRKKKSKASVEVLGE